MCIDLSILYVVPSEVSDDFDKSVNLSEISADLSNSYDALSETSIDLSMVSIVLSGIFNVFSEESVDLYGLFVSSSEVSVSLSLLSFVISKVSEAPIVLLMISFDLS